MADFGSLFNTRNDLVPGADYGKGLGGVKPSPFSNPEFIRMLAMMGGKLGAGMSDPGTFGKAAGETAVMMAQGGATNVGMAGVTPSASVAPATKVDPIAAAKQMKDGASLIDKFNKLDSSQMPAGYMNMIGEAFKATPPPVEGTASAVAPIAPAPTEGAAPVAPVANAFAQPQPQPAPQQPVTPAPQPLSDFGAMTIGPEGVKNIFAQGTAARDITLREQQRADTLGMQPTEIKLKEAQAKNYDSDAAYKTWEMSPEGQAAKYKLASAGVTEAAKADKEKIAYLRDATKAYLAANPEVANNKPEGFPMTIGQLMLLTAENSHAGTTFSSVLNSTLDYKASIDTNKVRMEMLKQSKKDSEDNKTYLEISRNAEILRKMNTMQSPDSFDISTPEGVSALSAAKIMGQVRTPGMDIEIKNLQKIQEQLYKKAGLTYNPLSYLEDTKKIVVTAEDLEKRVAGKRIKALEPGKFFNTAPGILNPEAFSDIVGRKPSGGI